MIAGSVLPSSSVKLVTECPRMLYSTDAIGKQDLGCRASICGESIVWPIYEYHRGFVTTSMKIMINVML